MPKLTDQLKIEVVFSGITLSSQTMTLKALLEKLNVLPEDYYLFLANDVYTPLEELLCERLVDDSSGVKIKKQNKKTMTHEEWSQFLAWVDKKYPDFWFYGEAGLPEDLELLKQELEQEQASQPAKEYKITEIVRAFKYIEYGEIGKYKTKAIKGLIEKWVKEGQDEV